MKKGAFVTETFNGVNEFLTVIGRRKPNMVFKNQQLSSEGGDKTFTMTKNYAESVEIMAAGYKDGLDKLKKCKGTAVHHMGRAQKNIPQAGIVGYAPHVPNAIAGIPQSMISSQKIEQHAKVLTIVYDCGAEAKVDAKDFVKAGRNILDVVMMLELQGYRVRLDIQEAFCTSQEKAICRITVKNLRQPINPLKISYLLLHPSFFRRQGFKWLETVPELANTEFRYGYGRPLVFQLNSNGASTDKVRQYLQTNNLLECDTFFTNFHEAVNHPADELIQLMGINQKKK